MHRNHHIVSFKETVQRFPESGGGEEEEKKKGKRKLKKHKNTYVIPGCKAYFFFSILFLLANMSCRSVFFQR